MLSIETPDTRGKAGEREFIKSCRRVVESRRNLKTELRTKIEDKEAPGERPVARHFCLDIIREIRNPMKFGN
jgi:hypothetical protein